MIDNFIEWMSAFNFAGMFQQAAEESKKRQEAKEAAELEDEDND